MKGVLCMNKNGNRRRFKWWWIELDGVKSYLDLLKINKADVTAMTDDNQIIKKASVPLMNEKKTVIADLGEDGEFYLLPGQWVNPAQSERITGYWLIDQDNSFNSPIIKQIYTVMDSGKICKTLPEGVTLFGNAAKATFARRQIEAIVPIGDNEYIAWDGRIACIIGDRETDETTIRIYLDMVL